MPQTSFDLWYTRYVTSFFTMTCLTSVDKLSWRHYASKLQISLLINKYTNKAAVLGTRVMFKWMANTAKGNDVFSLINANYPQSNNFNFSYRGPII